MAVIKQKSDKWARIVLAFLGVGLLLWNLYYLGLYFFGDVAPAYNVVKSRLGSRGDSDTDTEYRFSVSYNYLVDGVEYDGLDTGLRGPWLGPKVDKTVHYYPFAPGLSTLCAESAVSLMMVVQVGFSLALLWAALFWHRGKKGEVFENVKRDRAQPNPEPERVTMAWLMENTEGYDESLEEYYHNGWDVGDPSWECSCGHWNDGNFCVSCGKLKGSF